MDQNGNAPGAIDDSDGLQELHDWLFGRIADDNDVIVDKLQDKYGVYFEELEEKMSPQCEGTQEYKDNIKYLETTIAHLKTPQGLKDMQVSEGKQKITDGIRPCWYGGVRDQNGLPHGEGMIKYENQDTFTGVFEHGVLNREGKLLLASQGHLTAEGQWKDGLMDGEMCMSTSTGGWIEGYWKHGVPHGFQREFGHKGAGSKLHLRFVGRYYRGIRRGFCWRGLFGEGFICGFVDSVDGSFTGDDLAYIYPDFKTALRGKFKDEKLVSAQLCQLVGSTLENGMRIPIFTQPLGQVYTWEGVSVKTLGINPTLPDPWEETMVYVKPSLLPQGGEGLFARRPIPAKSVVCLFSGIRLHTSTLASQRMGHSDYRIRLNADVDLDIPAGYESLDRYCATLGHKANHSFLPNSEWIVIEHPRFGLIRGLKAVENIEQDSEILINYQMNLADSPEWYRIVWLRFQRHHKKATDASIGRLLDRYYENSGKRVWIPETEELNVPEPKGISDDLDELAADAERQLSIDKKSDRNGVDKKVVEINDDDEEEETMMTPSEDEVERTKRLLKLLKKK